MDHTIQLMEKLRNKTARVAVLGMGYVGLPFATVFSEAGFEVTGIDPIPEKMETLNRGESYIMDVSTEQVVRQIGRASCRERV